ncbi:putative bifunctional diguanylate cyclase/phosphodiesterase [Marinobacter sp.]|uniref:putative bifunctional diguanylate cyclase/phosphodiesterase n=1 Tax=Marinobacter sp. TaxID=50741 RepID=UPI003850CCF0
MRNTNEQARLKELFSLDILDTQREERFDRITHLVSEIFDVAVVAVSLVDEHRQWFKSIVGISECEIPRNESVCSWALHRGYLEIPDALEDDVFQDHPAVTGSYQLRFYAGCVLYGPTGQPLGTLCLNDFLPRKLNSRERVWLECFTRMVEQEINRDFELEARHRAIQDVTLRDITTGLPGETLLTDTLDSLITVANEAGQQLAVLHLQVDNLDTLVRLHGRSVRDEVLQTLADRITTPADRILAAGRTGAAQFVLVIPMEPSQAPFDIAGRILERLSAPVIISVGSLRPEIDAGVCVYPADGTEASQLMDRARIALQDRTAQNRVHVFTHEGNAQAIRRHSIEAKLETALLQDQLTLNYQPIFLADGSRIASFEALARWEDQELGMIGPGEFVPIAERSDRLSHLLTLWVLRSACLEARTWSAQVKIGAPRVAVNIPSREFYNPEFVATIKGILRETGMDPARLSLELTEESLIQDIEQTIETMNELSRLGIKLALDDFGTGYSSLSHLRRLPVNTLKIDKSFIDDLPHQSEAVKLATGIIQIAQNMGCEVVAEGVEHETQRALLESIGCDLIQGYLLGRPIRPEDVSGLLGKSGESRD